MTTWLKHLLLGVRSCTLDTLDQEPTGIPAGRESRRRDQDFSPGPGPGHFVSLAGILAGILFLK